MFDSEFLVELLIMLRISPFLHASSKQDWLEPMLWFGLKLLFLFINLIKAASSAIAGCAICEGILSICMCLWPLIF